MTIRRSIVLVLALVLTCSLLIPTASAQIPGTAPCRGGGNTSLSGWTTHAKLGDELEMIESISRGRVDVEVIGESHRGRDIWAARVGDGDRVLLVTSAIHGNEKTGTEALLQILRFLGTRNSPAVDEILDGITLVAVPMFNPDGNELNRRQNDFPWDEVQAKFPQLANDPPAWYYSRGARGFDVNRDFNPDLDYEPQAGDMPSDGSQPGFFLTNEARALRELYKDLRDEFGHVDGYVDLHHMGPCNQIEGEEDGQYVTVSLDYPPLGPDDSDKYAEWEDLDQAASRRLAYAAYLGMADRGSTDGRATRSPFMASVARYLHPEERDLPGQARSSFALNGTSTVLFEVRGQSHHYGTKMRGLLVQVVEHGLMGIIERMADGSVDDLDDQDFFTLPDYGWDD